MPRSSGPSRRNAPTPTCATATSTGPPRAAYSTSAASSTTDPRRSPSPWNSPTSLAWPLKKKRTHAYLRDDNEYRAATRRLLHLGGTLDYRPETITVTLEQPDIPRLAHALTHLIDELNHTPPRLPGDPRPITYKIKSQQ